MQVWFGTQTNCSWFLLVYDTTASKKQKKKLLAKSVHLQQHQAYAGFSLTQSSKLTSFVSNLYKPLSPAQNLKTVVH
jgi:hypothetical protein